MIQPGLIDFIDMLVGQAMLHESPESKSKNTGYVRPTSLGASWGNQGNRTGFVNQDQHIYRVHYDTMKRMQSHDSGTNNVSIDPSSWNSLPCCRAVPIFWAGKYVLFAPRYFRLNLFLCSSFVSTATYLAERACHPRPSMQL
jgi:YD repeat-containing protein